MEWLAGDVMVLLYFLINLSDAQADFSLEERDIFEAVTECLQILSQELTGLLENRLIRRHEDKLHVLHILQENL